MTLAGSEEEKKSTTVSGTSATPTTWWAALGGAAAGAVIVGAVWAISYHTHPADPVIASVGQTQIHKADFVSQLESQGGTSTLEQLIEDQLIRDGAKRAKITATKSEINSALQNLEAQYGISSSDQLNQFLQANGVTQAQLNNILEDQVLEQKLAEQGITVTDQEIQTYYNQNKAQFTPSGSKTPQPLSKVRSQIIQDIKATKATPPTQLLANLAKQDPIVIYDTKYASVKTTIENPSASGTSSTSSASAPSAASNTVNSAGQ
ncbi:MAG: SurA N-terminal domain-containing protein [Alicyclobacillus sp.]|nr:SurA N-terminal domain-containing protein [Alicyclobacillus sp.]